MCALAKVIFYTTIRTWSEYINACLRHLTPLHRLDYKKYQFSLQFIYIFLTDKDEAFNLGNFFVCSLLSFDNRS